MGGAWEVRLSTASVTPGRASEMIAVVLGRPLASRCRAVLLLAALLSCSAAESASARVVWLCHPDQARNPCKVPMRTTVLSAGGKFLGVRSVRVARRPRADCFYLYPTVSEQRRPVATLRIDPEQRAIARLQAARYSQRCRVFAPMYRQQTLLGLATGVATKAQVEIAYRSVERAWRAYRRGNPRRAGRARRPLAGVSELLRRLVAERIDGDHSARRLLLSAQLLGRQRRRRQWPFGRRRLQARPRVPATGAAALRDRVLGLRWARSGGRRLRSRRRAVQSRRSREAGRAVHRTPPRLAAAVRGCGHCSPPPGSPWSASRG